MTNEVLFFPNANIVIFGQVYKSILCLIFIKDECMGLDIEQKHMCLILNSWKDNTILCNFKEISKEKYNIQQCMVMKIY